MSNFIRKGVIPLLAISVLLYLGQYIYMVDGQLDWFRLAMVIGIPMGIPYMFVIIPLHWNLSGLLGMMVLCIMVGGLFGCFIAAFLVIRAVIYVIMFPICQLKSIIF